MSDLYLIAVKSRGEPSFEIAERMTCPNCQGDGNLSDGVIGISGDDGMIECTECDGTGHWYITTSGYRAHPYRYWDMEDICDGSDYDAPRPMSLLDRMPPDAIDLFPARQAKPDASFGKSLLAKLGLIPKVVRRL